MSERKTPGKCTAAQCYAMAAYVARMSPLKLEYRRCCARIANYRRFLADPSRTQGTHRKTLLPEAEVRARLEHELERAESLRARLHTESVQKKDKNPDDTPAPAPVEPEKESDDLDD